MVLLMSKSKKLIIIFILLALFSMLSALKLNVMDINQNIKTQTQIISQLLDEIKKQNSNQKGCNIKK